MFAVEYPDRDMMLVENRCFFKKSCRQVRYKFDCILRTYGTLFVGGIVFLPTLRPYTGLWKGKIHFLPILNPYGTIESDGLL